MTKFIKLYTCIHILWNQWNGSFLKKVQSFVWNLMRVRPKVSNKSPYCQSYGFSSSHIWRWELDHKKGWVLKNWWFWIKVLAKTLESPLDSKDIKPVYPKGLNIHWKDGCWSPLTQRTWVWANSGRQWRTGKPGVLQSLRLQRVGHNWATEQQEGASFQWRES